MSTRPAAEAHVQIDEPQVRVTEHRFAPGAETGWHRHEADYVVVPLADGDLLLEEPGGGSRTTKLQRHVPYARREGVEHNVVNANAYDFSFIEIEHLVRDSQAERQTLDRFVTAWNDHDLDAIMACFTEDCVFWSSAGPSPQGGVFEGKRAVEEAYRAIFNGPFPTPNGPTAESAVSGVEPCGSGHSWAPPKVRPRPGSWGWTYWKCPAPKFGARIRSERRSATRKWNGGAGRRMAAGHPRLGYLIF